MSSTALLSASPSDSDPYKGYLDPTFDTTFEALKLSWLPWVGRYYRQSARKTIVLGESIYVYRVKGKGVSSVPKARAKIEGRTSLRARHLSHGIEANHPSAFVRAFERAVFLKKTPNRADREKLWCEVIYHNLVPNLLDSLADRPSDDGYEDGWRAFLEMASAVGATRCIVYGHEKRKVQALLRVLNGGQHGGLLQKETLPVVGKRAMPVSVSPQLAGGQRLDMLFIGHPRRCFSWKKWGKLMQEREMRPAQQEPVLQVSCGALQLDDRFGKLTQAV